MQQESCFVNFIKTNRTRHNSSIHKPFEKNSACEPNKFREWHKANCSTPLSTNTVTATGTRRDSGRKAASSWRDHAEPEECCRSRCRFAQSYCFGRIRKSRQPVPNLIQIHRRNPAWSMESAQERSLFYSFYSLSPWFIFLKAVLGLE